MGIVVCREVYFYKSIMLATCFHGNEIITYAVAALLAGAGAVRVAVASTHFDSVLWLTKKVLKWLFDVVSG